MTAVTLVMLNTLSHEVMDPARDLKNDTWLLQQIGFYLGVSCGMLSIIVMQGNINIYHSVSLIWFFNISLDYYVSK
jgi:hypothetical protein